MLSSLTALSCTSLFSLALQAAIKVMIKAWRKTTIYKNMLVLSTPTLPSLPSADLPSVHSFSYTPTCLQFFAYICDSSNSVHVDLVIYAQSSGTKGEHTLRLRVRGSTLYTNTYIFISISVCMHIHFKIKVNFVFVIVFVLAPVSARIHLIFLNWPN